METFAEVLSSYVQRAGISDTELARAIGVSRQTIFRWREGLTSRPNNREDVLAIAEKLRLSSEERDHLLLVAGFRPEDITVAVNDEVQHQSIDLATDFSEGVQKESVAKFDESSELISEVGAETEKDSSDDSRTNNPITSRLRIRWAVVALASTLLVAVLIGWVIIGSGSDNGSSDTTSANTNSGTTAQPGSSPNSDTFVPAALGENLIVIMQFGDSSDGEEFTQKLVEALEREVYSSRLSNNRVDVWPEIITKSNKASQLLTDSGAVLVIYGEYASSQTVVHFSPSLEETAGVTELLITNNANGQLEMRSLALMTLGYVSIIEDDMNQALTYLAQTRNVLSQGVKEDGGIGTAVEALLVYVNDEME